jgi:hypothetical protein
MTPSSEILLRKLGFEDCGQHPHKIGVRRWLKQRALPHVLIEVPVADNAEEDWVVDAIFRAGMKYQQELTAGKWSDFLNYVRTPPKDEMPEIKANQEPD